MNLSSDKKAIVREIWEECFIDTPQWLDMFFSKAYNDNDALILKNGDKPVCSMLLRQYEMTFWSENIKTGYIIGAATKQSERGKGFMSELIRVAIHHAYKRGDLLISLIPASKSLFSYYSKFGFSSVFKVDKNIYDSDFNIITQKRYCRISDFDFNDAYKFFHKCEIQNNGTILHSPNDFSQIIEDNKLDNGIILTIRQNGEREIAAIGFAIINTEERQLLVKDILYIDNDAYNGWLKELKRLYHGFSIIVIGPINPEHGDSLPFGMMRIVNVGKILAVIARQNKNLKISIQVHDNLLPENNAVFIIKSGFVSSSSQSTMMPNLDITIDTLTEILFGNINISELPNVKPFMSLMLE